MKTIIEVRDSIAETMKKIGAPLSEDQSLALAGCLGVWLNQSSDAPPAAQSAEPTLHQYRMRPTWTTNRPWLDWTDCSAEQYADYLAKPLIHEWEYQVRALYTHPQPAPCDSAQLEPPEGWSEHPECESCEAFHDLGSKYAALESEYEDLRQQLEAQQPVQGVDRAGVLRRAVHQLKTNIETGSIYDDEEVRAYRMGFEQAKIGVLQLIATHAAPPDKGVE